MTPTRTAPVLLLLSLSQVFTSWSVFASKTYHYTVRAPASYRHIVIHDSANHAVDYYYPTLGLGSFTTNVNVYGVPGATAPSAADYLRSVGGHDIHVSGTATIMGHRYNLTSADFGGLVPPYTTELVDFTAGGMVWHLTLSYDHRFRSLRPTFLRIIASFQLHRTAQ